MTILITTGNKCDIVQELDEDDNIITVGLLPWGGDFILLTDPKALAMTILDNLSDFEKGE